MQNNKRKQRKKTMPKQKSKKEKELIKRKKRINYLKNVLSQKEEDKEKFWKIIKEKYGLNNQKEG